DGLDAAAALEAQGEADERLVATYRAALGCYEGPFLQAFTSHEAWCDRERERLAHRFAEGALRLARLLAAQGDDAGCLDWCSRLLAQEPLTEEAHRLLMLAHYRQGDRAAALRTYDRCVVLLSDELDIDPMPETQRLAKRIEAGEAGP
ncbi:MAG: bacterial transcriptional activator domain-containing protein, partial [Candidatus Sericytochromatia bacterium]|nr:bacterial transcriptional activator domain-containing protein [Candidatus Sericytochromatia bacterium]